jgi:hypothetical protein
MDREDSRREALSWFRHRLLADDLIDGLRAQARHLKPVPAEKRVQLRSLKKARATRTTAA